MKKLLIVTALAFGCCSFIPTAVVAQASDSKMDHKMEKDGSLTMKDGKMMMMKDGKWMAMDKEMMMPNGNKVMMDGTVMMKDGKKMMMKNGDMMKADGMMSKKM